MPREQIEPQHTKSSDKPAQTTEGIQVYTLIYRLQMIEYAMVCLNFMLRMCWETFTWKCKHAGHKVIYIFRDGVEMSALLENLPEMLLSSCEMR